MASRFLIELQAPRNAREGGRLLVMDEGLGESTGWLKLPVSAKGAPPETQLAAAWCEHEAVRSMLEDARQVAYAVYFGDASFDIHAFLPMAEEKWKEYLLNQRLPQTKTVRLPARM